jgi:hypothetical protein
MHVLGSSVLCNFNIVAGEKNVVSPFEQVAASAHHMALWEPFWNNVDMDLQVGLIYISCGVKISLLTLAKSSWCDSRLSRMADMYEDSHSTGFQNGKIVTERYVHRQCCWSKLITGRRLEPKARRVV